MKAILLAVSLCLALLSGCGGSEAAPSSANSGEEAVAGEAGFVPAAPLAAGYVGDVEVSENGGTIDLSSLAEGYVVAKAESSSRLKFQVRCNGMAYNYDLPNDGTPLVAPLNMGDGSYGFGIMQNTSANNYIEITSATEDVVMESSFAPYLRPNVYCSFTADSACAKKARELTKDCQSEGAAVEAIFSFIASTVRYDTTKAAALENASGYVPNPDETLKSKKGICFDYSSLGAAMLRSVGIPCKVVTGYVSPDGLYHAWNMVYIDENWVATSIDIDAGTWSRLDMTFAAGGASADFIGSGTEYTDRYTY